MMQRCSALVVGLWLLAGCEGAAMDPDAGQVVVDAGRPDAGPPPIKYDRFTRRADGLPMGVVVKGAAAIDNTLFVATSAGLFALPNTETRWMETTSPLSGDQKPTSLQRVDQLLVMTAAGATTGGLFIKPYDGAWTPVVAAPNKPAWLLVKKSSEWLLVTTGGLYAATALEGPWTLRSGTLLFNTPVTRLVAAPAQQTLFAAADTGVLQQSSNLGATWAPTSLRGTVQGVAAQGAYVIAATSMDGQQRSDNYGNTFRPLASPLTGTVLTYVVQGTTFWAGTTGGLFSSDDGAATFTANSSGLPAGTAVRGLFFAQGYVVADTPDGPFVNQQP